MISKRIRSCWTKGIQSRCWGEFVYFFIDRYSENIARKLDIVSLFVEVVVPRFFGTIQQSQKKLFESSMNGPTPDVPIQDIFALYRRSKTVMKMYHAFVPE